MAHCGEKCSCYGCCSRFPTFHFCCFKFPLRTGCFVLGTLRIMLWIFCLVLACYHHLNTELESGPDTFVSLVTVVAFPISMFTFDSLMLITIFMRKAKPLLIWIYFNILATLLPLGVSLTEDFSDSFDISDRLIFCVLVTFPSVYGILIVFSYYRELSQSEGRVLIDPRFEGSEYWLATTPAPASANGLSSQQSDIHLMTITQTSEPGKADFV